MCIYRSHLMIVFLVSFLNCLCIKSVTTTQTNFKPSLQLETVSSDRVVGCYAGRGSLGLCFDVYPGHFVLTKQKSGEKFISFIDCGSKAFHFQILDHSFIGQNASLRLVSRSAQGTDVLCAHQTDSSSDGFDDTDSRTSRKYLEEISEMISKTPETSLLKDLSHALATSNTNSDRMLQSLYLMGVGVAYLTKPDQHQKRRKIRPNKEKRLRRKNCYGKSWAEDCQDLRSDPYKNDCLGMCGPGCSCWEVICKDCCFHEGCKEHDLCCRHRAFSTFCLTPFLYGFNCNGFGGYPKCLN